MTATAGSHGSVSPESAEVALNDSITLTVTPDNGYAVDTINIDGQAFVNNGKSDPPSGSTWLSIVIADVTANHTITVTFAACTDDTGVPDKFKHTVTATAGPGGAVVPESQLVVDGRTAEIEIIPDEGMAVDTITAGETVYVNDGTE